MMTKDADTSLKLTRNGENDCEKSVPTSTKEEIATGSISSIKPEKGVLETSSTSPDKENQKRLSPTTGSSSSSFVDCGESSSKKGVFAEKNNKYSVQGQQSSREQENNKKNSEIEDLDKDSNKNKSPATITATTIVHTVSSTTKLEGISTGSIVPSQITQLQGESQHNQRPCSSTSSDQQPGQGRSASVGSARSPLSLSIGEPMGLPSEQLLMPSHPSSNGHETGSIKNGLKRQNSGRRKWCGCWCCCFTCSSKESCVRKMSVSVNLSACFPSLALRNSEPKAKDSESDLNCDPDPPPTLEEIRGWGESFDKLMHSSGGRKVFRDFLKCEYSEENILFWLACEELKKERLPEVIEEKARLIYEDYISILSPKEVSLDSRVRDLVNENMRNPKPTTFDEAQLQIYTLMHRDSYPRFVNSPLYKKLAQLNNTTTPTMGGPSVTLTGAGSHRGSTVSATSPASRKQSAAS